MYFLRSTPLASWISLVLALPHISLNAIRTGWWLLAVLLMATGAQAQSIDRALAFTDSGYVDLGDPGDAFDLAPGSGRTFAFWIRHDTTLYHAKLLDKRTKGGPGATGVFGYSLFVQQFTGTLGVYLTPVRPVPRADAFIGTAGLRPVIDKTWHHVAFVQDDRQITAYVDGTLDFSYTVPIDDLVTDKPLWLGWNSRDIVHFRGQMDELMIWHRALSRQEIRRVMYDRPEPGTPDLAAYWSFDDDDPAVVRDVSGNGYHGQGYHVYRIAASRPLHPPFRETFWFYVVWGLAGIAVLTSISWLSAAGLRARNRQLEALVRERTAEVEQQAEELKTLDAAKSRFFANISHEFRTPLTLSLGLLDDLLGERQETLTEPVRTDLQQITRSNRILLRLVNQLLDVARIEAHELTLQIRRIDLAQVLRLISAAFASVAERDQITFDQELPATCIGWVDPEQVELIVTNLLSNAFKFTPTGGRIRVELETDEETAELRVRDTGAGIPAHQLAHVFDRFYQTDDSHQQIGTGIGLAFVKEVVALHGGTVAVESTVGFGTCFTVTLPTTRAHYETLAHVSLVEAPLADMPAPPEAPPSSPEPFASPTAPAPAQEAASEDQTTVLIVDDNADIRAFIRRHLGKIYHLLEAEDGEAALQVARTTLPDLVISDVMMPRLDGFGLVEAMRADPDLNFVPVLLLTARAEPEDKLAGLGLGADAYLTKPFSTEELRLRVHNAIARQQRLRHRLQQELAHPTNGAAPKVPGAPNPNGSAFLDEVRAVARQHLAEEGFGVEALADALAMERTTLYRRLREHTDQSPTVLLRELRLDEAARLLREGAGTVSEVAYAVGFQSISYFSRRFKERFGTSPSQYSG